MSDIENVLAAALRLSPDQRAEVVAELLDSLDGGGPPDAAVEEAWAREAERRLVEIDAGTVTTVPWTEVRRRLHAAASGRREGP